VTLLPPTSEWKARQAQRTFGLLANTLGPAISWRTTISPAIVAGIAELTAAKSAPHEGPRPEGPCGDGNRTANACRTDKDGCTGGCDLHKGKNCDSPEPDHAPGGGRLAPAPA
jgi:hypothetical protein